MVTTTDDVVKKVVEGVIKEMKKETESRILGENQILYKIIFGIIALFGIGSTYILFILQKTSFNMLEFLFVTIGISGFFIILGFIIMFALHKIFKNMCNWNTDTISSVQKKMAQDFSITFSFIVAFAIYFVFLIWIHGDKLKVLILG